MKNIKYHISMIKRGLAALMKMDKGFVVLYLTIEAINPLTPYVNIYMAARIINELAGNRNANTLILYVLATVGANMVLSLALSGLGHLKNYHENQFFKGRSMVLSEKNMAMDYENMESREVNILFERIKIETQTGYNVFYLYYNAGIFIKNIINIILAAALTFNLFANPNISITSKSIIFAMIAAVIFANYFSAKKSNKIYSDMYSSFAPVNGFYNFYDNYCYDYNAGKDTRLYSMEEFVANEQDNIYKFSNDISVSTAKKGLKYNLFNSITTDTLRIATYIFVILACVAGSVAIGDITKYVSCIIMVISSFVGIIGSVQMLVENNKYLERYFQFFDIPNKMQQGRIPVEKRRDREYEIEFRNVSFKYPGSETYALKNLSLKFKIGQRMAVVGQNGSGKTTMIKLLCRLYDPTEGVITLNGFDIR
ncbi:MAG: ABC transporter ATP-binding protein/permease, partial [Oscillospiraceae bacterium]|nr:ABC transporter ATP-binding protein/permease [Oscillospiraceae bacterium]